MRSKHLSGLLYVLIFTSTIALPQNPKQELNDQFWEAVRRGDAPAVTALLDKGADVNAKFRYGTTALFKAAERGHLEVVKILLARGADVTVKDTFYGATAMTWALDNNHADVVNALLEKQPSSADEVLMTGVGEGKTDLVKVALGRGGLKKEVLSMALSIASANKEKPEIADLLKAAGAVALPEVSTATLQSYAGRYSGDGGGEVTITFFEGRLFGAPKGERPRPLFAINETTFRPLIEGIVVVFKIEGGKVTGLTLTQGTSTTQWTRVVETKQP